MDVIHSALVHRVTITHSVKNTGPATAVAVKTLMPTRETTVNSVSISCSVTVQPCPSPNHTQCTVWHTIFETKLYPGYDLATEPTAKLKPVCDLATKVHFF